MTRRRLAAPLTSLRTPVACVAVSRNPRAQTPTHAGPTVISRSSRSPSKIAPARVNPPRSSSFGRAVEQAVRTKRTSHGPSAESSHRRVRARCDRGRRPHPGIPSDRCHIRRFARSAMPTTADSDAYCLSASTRRIGPREADYSTASVCLAAVRPRSTT